MRTVLVLALVATGPMAAVAGQAPPGRRSAPWTKTIVVAAGVGSHDQGSSAGQEVRLRLARGKVSWLLGVSHHSLIGAEGYGVGVTHQRAITDGLGLGLGISTGTNTAGGLYPKYQVGGWLRAAVAPGFSVLAGFNRRQAREFEAHTDRYGAAVVWYAPGPWIVEGSLTHAVGHPGNTRSWSGGGGVTFERWRKLYIGASVSYGDGSYVHLPSQQLVEYAGWAYRGRIERYLSPRVSVNLAAGHSDYYGGASVTLSVAQTW